jgi:ABC-type branched-subunit amino acid transport system substrate-binding protein
MTTNRPFFLHPRYLIICIIIFCLSACSQVPPKKPVEKDKALKEAVEPVKEEIKKEQPKISIIETLTKQAKKFSLQGNYQDAIIVYNQALSYASEAEKPPLIFAIELVLAKTSAKDIQEFINIKNILIPKSLLVYWLGLNYALENNIIKSKEILETFLLEYSDHPYYSDAADLLSAIKKSLFKRDTIGCLLPLTGKYAIFGQRALTGIQLAIQDLSKKYNRKFKLIIKDTQANPDVTVKCIRQLYQKNVAGIIGPLLTVQQAGQEAEKFKIPIIALTQKSDFPLQGDYLFANFITPEMQVQTLGAYLFLKLGIKKVAMLYPNEKYGKKYMKLFWDIVDEYDGEVVGVEPYDGRKTDFATPIQKLTGQFFPVPDFLKPEVVEPENELAFEQDQTDMALVEPDAQTNVRTKDKQEKIQIDFEALFIPDSPSKLKMILPQLAFYDARGMYLVGTNLWHHKSLLKDVKGYNKLAVIADGFFDGSKNPATAEFTKNFKTLFNKKPKFLEAISYDTTSILFSAAMDEDIDSRQSFKDALKDQRIFKGVTGDTFFDADGKAHRDLFLMTIKRGKFVEINQ